LKNQKVEVRLAVLVAVLLVPLVIAIGLGVRGMNAIDRDAGEIVEAQRLAADMSRILVLMDDNRVQLLLSLQHDPASPFHTLHDHPLSIHTEKIQQNIAEISERVESIKLTPKNAEEAKLLDEFAQARGAFVKDGLLPARDALLAGDFGKTNEIYIKQMAPLFLDARKHGDAFEKITLVHVARTSEHAHAEFAADRTILLVAGAAGLALAAFFAVLVGRSITTPLSAVTEIAEFSVCHDDFTRAVPVSGKDDEISRLAYAFNGLMEKFRTVIGATQSSGARIADESRYLASAAQQVMAGSGSQAEATSTVAAAVEQISVSINETAQHAHESEAIAAASMDQSEHAMVIIRTAMSDIDHIAASVKNSSQRMALLAESSSQIGEIVSVIKDIADQTNLLALNAAIEAARAGEQGRGFAVVADEVRKLAERTTRSTQEIGALIDTIQTQVGQTVSAMQAADTQAAHTARQAGQAGEELGKIRSGTREVSTRVKDIAGAIREQSAAVQQIAANIEKIAQMTEENSAAAAGNSDGAARLDGLAEGLSRSVAQFRV